MLIRDHQITETINIQLNDKSDFKLDTNGYMNVDARISRTGIQTYSGDEIPGGAFKDQSVVHVLRPASEVFAADSLKSFSALPITAGHPEAGVNSENYTAETVGISIGEPVRDGEFVKVSLSIRDKVTVEAIKANGGVEISNGYTVDLDTTAGTTNDGDSYDAIQRNIRGNHIALVDAARCGPECRIGDEQVTDCGCASCNKLKETEMSDVKKTIRGITIAMSDQASQAVDTLEADIVDLNAQLEQSGTQVATHAQTIADRDATIAEKDGEIAALKAAQMDDAAIDALVADRAALIAAASAIIGDDSVDLSAMSADDVRKTAVTAKYGEDFVGDADANAIKGMFSVASKDVTSDALEGTTIKNTINVTQAHDAAYQARVERLRTHYKGA